MTKLMYFNNHMNMKNSSMNMIFFSTLMFSTMITLNSSSWMMAWMGLEMNLLSFIPIMMNNSNNYKISSSTMTYFIVQTSSSSILLMTMMIMNLKSNMENLIMMKNILQITLIMKLGAAPLHWWLPKIINNLSWMNCFILLTWQKIAPLFLLISLNNSPILYLSMMMSSFIGAILGMNQNSLKMIMMYSSINHLSWMMMAMNLNLILMKFYFLIYSMISMMICITMNNFNLNFMNQLFNNFNNNIYTKMMTMFMFFSMAGIPPFIGFLPKIIILMLMTKNFLKFEIIFFIIMTLITLSYYLNPLISALTLMNSNNKWTNKINYFNNKMFFIIIMCSLIMMLLIMPMFNY
uniref:NADH-ubiquinone oxidoreductase chain 2 n=1 Tax=Heptamelus sp. TaxID=2821555 RepID=A0A8A6C3N1_9HYME|nr:NADH dehydrogenase subunit 2 [Heptamelus sp.]